MITKCADCGSEDILQEVSYMLNPNTFEGDIPADDDTMMWKDSYHCNDCNEECEVDEIDEG